MGVDTVDKRFALIAKNGEVRFPYQKSQDFTGRYGFALTAPGEKDRKGGGTYTADIEEVIKRMVFDGWGVRAMTTEKSGKQRGNSVRIGKSSITGYWLSDELKHLVTGAKMAPSLLPGLSTASSGQSSLNFSQSSIKPLQKETAPKSETPAKDEKNSIENLQNEVNSESAQIAIEFANSPGKDIDAVVKRRIGQSAFRSLLEKKYGSTCFISGIANSRLLIASHIVPWSRSLPEQKTDAENGLLLSIIWDALFDKGFISFDGEGALLCSPLLDQATRKCLGISLEVRLSSNFMTEKRKSNLSWHRENIFDKAE